jgi:hypothetical protein
MDTLEQTIADIRGRNITLSVRDEKIVASLPLGTAEKEMLRENRERAIAIITAAPETPPAACGCAHHREGYLLGVQHATEELASRAPVAAPVAQVAPAVLPNTTPDQEIEKFIKWQGCKSDYYKWESECLEALRSALAPGERIQPMFAYSCIIIGGNGKEREFKRVPNKRKAV